MPQNYVKKDLINTLNLPANIGMYKNRKGYLIYKTNRTYQRKKPFGPIIGTRLTEEDIYEIKYLISRGCMKKRIISDFGISHYYLKKVLAY